ASMGLAVGAGHIVIGWMVLVSVLIIQFVIRLMANWIDKHSSPMTSAVTYHLYVNFDPVAANSIRSTWSAFAARTGVSAINYSEMKKAQNEIALKTSFCLPQLNAADLHALGQSFADLPGVISSEWSQGTS